MLAPSRTPQTSSLSDQRCPEAIHSVLGCGRALHPQDLDRMRWLRVSLERIKVGSGPEYRGGRVVSRSNEDHWGPESQILARAKREVPVTRSWTSSPLTLLATKRRRPEWHRRVGSRRARKPMNPLSTLLLSHWRSKVRRGEPQLQGAGHPVLFRAWQAQHDRALPYGTWGEIL